MSSSLLASLEPTLCRPRKGLRYGERRSGTAVQTNFFLDFFSFSFELDGFFAWELTRSLLE